MAGGNGQDEYTDEELLVVEVLSCLKSLCTISSKACNLEESSKASCVGLKIKIRSVILDKILFMKVRISEIHYQNNIKIRET